MKSKNGLMAVLGVVAASACAGLPRSGRMFGGGPLYEPGLAGELSAGGEGTNIPGADALAGSGGITPPTGSTVMGQNAQGGAPNAPSAPGTNGAQQTALANLAAIAATLGMTLSPATPSANANQNANPTGGNTLNYSDFAAQNTARVNSIRAAAAPFAHLEGVSKVVDEAVANANVTVEKFSADLIGVVSKGLTPQGAITPADIAMGATGWDREKSDLSTALVLQLSPATLAACSDITDERSRARAERAARAAGFDSMNAVLAAQARVARDSNLRSLTLRGLAVRCAAAGLNGRGGVRIGYDDASQLMEASFSHSTSDLPALMRNTASRALQAQMALQDTTWRRVCGRGNAKDFRPRDMIRTGQISLPQRLANGKKPAELAATDKYESLGLDTSAGVIKIDRKTLINDDLGGIAQALGGMGTVFEVAKELRFVEVLVAGTSSVLSDGQPVLSTARGNLAASGTALGYDTWLAATTAMRMQKDIGKSALAINVAPKFLFTPVALWATANELCKSEKLPKTGEANTNRDNVVRRAFPMEDLSSFYLDAQSAVSWYLFADPAVVPAIVMSHLNGNENPEVTTKVEPGIGMEITFINDFEANWLNPEGCYKNPGN